MRRHFPIPEGCQHVALDRDLRQAGRGGYYYHFDGVPANTMVLVGDQYGKFVSHRYMVVQGDAVATQANKVQALSQAVAELAMEKAPIIANKMATTMTANVVEEFHQNAHSAVLVSSFSQNAPLVQQLVVERGRAQQLANDMATSGLTDFLAEEEERVRQKRARREARQRGEQ